MPLSAMLPILQAVFHEGVVITADALGNICLKPRSQFQPKGFIFGAIVKIHDSHSCGCSLLHLSPLKLWGTVGGKRSDRYEALHTRAEELPSVAGKGSVR